LVSIPGPSGCRRNDRVEDYRALGASWGASPIVTNRINGAEKTAWIIITPTAYFL